MSVNASHVKSSNLFAGSGVSSRVRTHTLLLAPFLALIATAAACSKKADTTQTQQAQAEETTAAIATVAIERPATPSREGSTVVLGKLDGKKVAFVADEDTGTVRTIDLAAQHEIGSVTLGSRPGQLLVTKAGQLAVALRDDASVALLDARPNGTLVLGKKTTTPNEPVGLTLSPDDATLYVVTGYSHTLQAFRLDEQGNVGDRVLDVSVEREPRAVALSHDGKRAFVAHAASSTLEEVDVSSAKIAQSADLGIPASPVLGELGMRRPMPMPMRRPMSPNVIFDALIPVAIAEEAPMSVLGDCFDCAGFDGVALPARFARQGYAFAHVDITTTKGPVEGFVVPHTEVMTGDPMVISTGYGGGGIEADSDEPTERFTLSLMDAATGKRKLLSQPGDARNKDGCHLPRGAATDGTGNVYVACFGSDSIMAFTVAEKTVEVPVDPPETKKLRFAVDAKGSVKAKIATRKVGYLTMSSEGRIPVAAGPSGVALDAEDNRLVTFSQLDGSLSLISTNAFGSKDAKTDTTTTIKLLRSNGLTEQASNGRKLFFSGGDQRVSKDGRACSSCHPDGRDDGLVWSTPDGPRQTIMLAGRVNRQGPFGWLGKHPTLQVHMQTTMKNLKGTGLDASEQDSLASFLTQLKGPTQKYRALTTAEVHGRDVFNSSDAQCSSCHAEKSGFTDHDTHNVKSATISDQTKEFLVPSLTDVAGSAPYFHDGRYASLEDLINKCDGTMGSTKQLSANDKGDLAAYLRTL
jgi:DNA-binding beta-propeller fold protein YncE/mono/diheme cytochrome c family protein